MDCIEFTIKPLAEREVALVEQHINFDWAAPEKHADRFRRQQEGHVVYLVAWVGELPVGHALIKWGGSDVETVSSRLHLCPEIEDLYVVPDYRLAGIGSSLLAQAHISHMAEYPSE